VLHGDQADARNAGWFEHHDAAPRVVCPPIVPRGARVSFVWIGVALAVWLIPASIHIVDWTADGPVRVALFAPLWKLWAALGFAAVATVATEASHRGREATASDSTSGAVTAPLALMWLW